VALNFHKEKKLLNGKQRIEREGKRGREVREVRENRQGPFAVRKRGESVITKFFL
jgi:hypothetical protein